MPINTTHSDYEQALPLWQKCADFVAGTVAVKAQRERYLPRPNPDDLTIEANLRYENYLSRAVFYEYSSDTVNRYIGLAFKKDPILELDTPLDVLKRDADGAGVSLYQQAQKGLECLLKTARFGLLVDYPSRDGSTTRAEQARLNLRPKVLFYTAFDIINWHIAEKNNIMQPVMIVLREYVSEPDIKDSFVYRSTEQYRYLGLDDNGYFVEVWRSNNGRLELFNERTYPLDANGKMWQVIPFQIFGSNYNTFDIQKIPIEPLVHIEQGIYCNSADAENSRFLCGQIQPYMVMDDRRFSYYTEVDEFGKLKRKLRIGSESVLMLGDGGVFGFAQAQPNTMATEGIAEKRDIIGEIGLQIGQVGSAIKTATQSEHEATAQYSKVSLCIANLNEGYSKVLQWCAQFAGSTGNNKFQIKQDFVTPQFDAGMFQQLASLVDGGKLPKSVIFNKAREANLIDPELSDDDIEGMIDSRQFGVGIGQG